MASSSELARKKIGGAWALRSKLSPSSGVIFDSRRFYFSDYDSAHKAMIDDYLWGQPAAAGFLAGWALGATRIINPVG